MAGCKGMPALLFTYVRNPLGRALTAANQGVGRLRPLHAVGQCMRALSAAPGPSAHERGRARARAGATVLPAFSG